MEWDVLETTGWHYMWNVTFTVRLSWPFSAVFAILDRLVSQLYNQIKSNQIRLLATAPLIHSTGAQVQAYNYNANTITINNKSKKTLKSIMPLKCLLYRWVLRFDKNTVLDAEFRRSDGRTFQAAGPATVNAPSANFVLVLTTEKFPCWVERRA